MFENPFHDFLMMRLKLTFRWIYWTEHKSGATGVEVFSCKNNGQRYRKLLSVDLHWPNSLVVNDDKLYIGDGRGKIIATDIEGWFLPFTDYQIQCSTWQYTLHTF